MGWVRLGVRLEVRVRVRVLHQKETQPVSQKKPSAFGFAAENSQWILLVENTSVNL